MITYIDLRTGAEMFGCRSSALCLGTFDGVHRGHAELINETLKMRDRLKQNDPQILGGAWCFRQPPASFLSDKACKQITNIHEKTEIFKSFGLDFVAIGDFEDLRNLRAEEFISDVLVKECGCKGVVCGFNFTFGKYGAGKPDILIREFKENAKVLPPVTYNRAVVSSSAIRSLILNGDTEYAFELMGRPYSISATVIEGKKLGRKLGFPTINQIVAEDKLLPRNGVYATKALIDGKEYFSVTNVGCNPTVKDSFVRCETYIIDYEGDLYGETVKLSFIKYLRPEQKFENIEELTAAVNQNIAETKKYFEI